MRGDVVICDGGEAARREALRAGDLDGLVGRVCGVFATLIFEDQVIVFTLLKDVVFQNLITGTEKLRLG